MALRRLHSTRVALAFALTALSVTFALGLAVNALLPVRGLVPAATESSAPGIMNILSAVLLCALSLWVLVREGPRGFLSQLSPSAEPHHH